MSLSVFAVLDAIGAGFANGFKVLGLPNGEPEGNGEGEAGGVKTKGSLGAPSPVKPANLGLGSGASQITVQRHRKRTYRTGFCRRRVGHRSNIRSFRQWFQSVL